LKSPEFRIGVQERLSVLAAPRMVRSTFLFARLRSAGGVYLSGGLKPATETSRILTYPPLIEAGVFLTEINRSSQNESGF
jgi:hypothetical protein